MAGELLYQAIMKVPGLTGTWQQRNAQLYKKLGSPMGTYNGGLSQNSWLLNQINKNNYYKAGLPGAQTTGGKTTGGSTNPAEGILGSGTQNIVPNTDIYSQDVMTQEAWFDPFDEWTRNFVNTYMKPGWERDTYNPAMQQMTKSLSDSNQQTYLSGAGRGSGAQKNLADMAKEMMTEEERMRQGFQEKSVETRDAIRSSLAVPLYTANMERWGDAPWRNIETGGADMEEIVGNLGGTLGGTNLEDLIASLNTWTPVKGDSAPVRDWTVTPTSPYKTSLFDQYTNRAY